MQSSDDAIRRFSELPGAPRRVEFLDEEGRVVGDARGAVEVRAEKPADGRLLTVRLGPDAAMRLGLWPAFA